MLLKEGNSAIEQNLAFVADVLRKKSIKFLKGNCYHDLRCKFYFSRMRLNDDFD